ncbi:TIGR04197 family type VII secretion effector [Terrilactibacillus sp. S3-3]|nr:TIGR04197 family type VII secretion effector [Terrilactibacillus sp. S3-3]
MNVIQLNGQVYRSTVSKLSGAAEDLLPDSGVKTELTATDVSRIKELDQLLEKWQHVLHLYQADLHAEVGKLEKVSQNIEEMDEKIAQFLSGAY